MATKRDEPTLDDLEQEARWVLRDYWSALVLANRTEPSEQLIERLQKAGLAYSQFESNMNPDDVE